MGSKYYSGLSFLLLALNMVVQPTFAKSTNVVQMFIAPPNKYLKWDSPKKITTSFITSNFVSHTLNFRPHEKLAMGHAMAHFQCTDTKNKTHDVWTGITNNGDTEHKMVLKDKTGTGILFANTDNGFIESEEEVKSTLSSYLGRKERTQNGDKVHIPPLFIEFDITAIECDQAVAFQNEFKKRAYDKPLDLNEREKVSDKQKLYFGLTMEPWDLYSRNVLNKSDSDFLGGGCTSFASAFLRATGKYDQDFDSYFYKMFQISDEAIGSKENQMPIKNILFGRKYKSWTKSFSHQKIFRFYDPEMIYGFFDALKACQGHKDTISECRSDIRDLLKNYNSEPSEITVTADYNKKINYTKTIHGVHLTRKLSGSNPF